jgi:hypothetical protein
MGRTTVFVCLTLLSIGAEGCNSIPLAPGCGDGSSSAQPLTGPPNFSGLVTKDTLLSGLSPEGYFSEYVVWVVIRPDSQVSATFATSAPAFIRATSGGLVGTCPGAAALGDSVEVWDNGSYVIGANPAVWASPSYFGRQIVINPRRVGPPKSDMFGVR